MSILKRTTIGPQARSAAKNQNLATGQMDLSERILSSGHDTGSIFCKKINKAKSVAGKNRLLLHV